MEQTQVEDWRNDVTESKDTLKIADGEVVQITFLNEGNKKVSQDFGNSIAFIVKKKGEDKDRVWYVNANNYALLAKIKTLGKLTGTNAKITRKGKYKSDTRYTIDKIE